jgi:hypothetical protein
VHGVVSGPGWPACCISGPPLDRDCKQRGRCCRQRKLALGCLACLSGPELILSDTGPKPTFPVTSGRLVLDMLFSRSPLAPRE